MRNQAVKPNVPSMLVIYGFSLHLSHFSNNRSGGWGASNKHSLLSITPLNRIHSCVWRIIIQFHSILFFIVRVMGSSGWFGTMCDQSRMVNVWFLCNSKLKSALDWSGIIERNQNYFVSSSSSAVAQKQVTIHEQGGRRNGLAYIGFPGLFLLFLPPSGPCMAAARKKGVCFFPSPKLKRGGKRQMGPNSQNP